MSEHTNPVSTSDRSLDSRTRLALVTGASSSIGQAFARRLGADGYNLVVVGRRRDRLEELVATLPGVEVRPLVADLGTNAGVEAVAEVCEREALTMLVNNAGVAHYMPFTGLPASKASELLHVKVVAPTMLARAAAPGMAARGDGTIINVSGMLAFGGPAPLGKAPGRAVYVGTLAHIVALSQASAPAAPSSPSPQTPADHAIRIGTALVELAPGHISIRTIRSNARTRRLNDVGIT